MYRAAASDPVQPISLSSALKITLDNYYDLLKSYAGVAQNEFLQLKLAADVLDIADDTIPASKGGYKWWSYHNMVARCDHQIQPSPVTPDPSGSQISAVKLSEIYGDFLIKLRSYVVLNNLSDADQKKVADINGLITQDKTQYLKLVANERANWKTYCDSTGVDVTDKTAYLQWSATWGNLKDIKLVYQDLQSQYFSLQKIMDKQYANIQDQKIVAAENDYINSAMQASYPDQPDYNYTDGDKFDIVYLINLGLSGTGAFDYTYVFNFDKSLKTIRSKNAGKFNASWDQTTGSSSSIQTDWSDSASGSYWFLSASASASEHTAIQEDFSKTVGLDLSAESVLRVNITYPQWFHPELFSYDYVKNNANDFQEFFGTDGSLLYYPLAFIVVRGFSVSFKSSQNWTYDYDHSFSAKAGGGFSIGCISFGDTASYGSHDHEHKIDQQNTSLTISDDKDTLRFVGYVLAKNAVYHDKILDSIRAKGLIARAESEERSED